MEFMESVRVRYILMLAGLAFLAAWLDVLYIEIRTNRPLPIPKSFKAKRAASLIAQSTCKPNLPGILLQQSPPSADHTALQPLLSQLAGIASNNAASEKVDSISIGVVGPQGLLWSKGFGTARANGTATAPPNDHTIYRVASISKLFATMEGFILSDKGVINWDDPVTKYIPNFTYNPQTWKEYLENNRQPSNVDGDRPEPITLRQLGSHTSGLGRDLPYYNVDTWPVIPPNAPQKQWPTLDEQLQAVAETPLVAPPGSFPVYSNTGFSLLGEALIAANSKAEGQILPYAELLKRDLFVPLGMNGSSFAASPGNAPYLAIPKINFEVDFDAGEAFQAPGAQFSSLSDLANATRFLLNPPPASGGGILRHSSLREWIRPSYGQPDNATETGLVWEISKVPDSHGRMQRFYGKSGDLSTFHSQLSFNRELQFGLVTLITGSIPAGSLSNVALPLLLPGFEAILEEKTKERYAGIWNGNNPDDEIVVVVEGGVLAIIKWKVNGHDFLQFYERGVLDRVSLWSTGKLDEFRIATGSAGVNSDPAWGCFHYWASLDSRSSRRAPVDLLYFEGEGANRVMQFPSANATLHRRT